MAKEELVVVQGEPKNIFKHGDVEGGEFTKHVYRWDTHGVPIKGDPQYVAFYVNGAKSVRVIAEIDYKNSDLDEGIIAIQGDPIRLCIPIRLKNVRAEAVLLRSPKYTTFRKLITHKSLKEFTKR